MILNFELESKEKKATVVYLKELTQDIPGRIEEDHKRPQSDLKTKLPKQEVGMLTCTP
jgi:hypothetical protein